MKGLCQFGDCDAALLRKSLVRRAKANGLEKSCTCGPFLMLRPQNYLEVNKSLKVTLQPCTKEVAKCPFFIHSPPSTSSASGTQCTFRG